MCRELKWAVSRIDLLSMRHATSHLKPARCSIPLQHRPPRTSILSLARTRPSSPLQPKIPLAALHQRTAVAAMSSDDSYSSFLGQANQDTGASAKASSTSQSASTKAVDREVPSALEKVEQYYVSEADEPFEPVSLGWSGENMPSESESSPSSIWVFRAGRRKEKHVYGCKRRVLFGTTDLILLDRRVPIPDRAPGRSLHPGHGGV